MECFLSFFFFFFYDTPNGKKKKVSGGLEKRRQKQVASIKPRWKKKKKKTTFFDLFVVVFVELFLVGSLVGKRRGQTSSLRSLASLVQARVCADRCSVTSFCAF